MDASARDSAEADGGTIIPAPASPATAIAPLSLQLGLRLQRADATRPWSAELTLPGTAGRLTFPDLASLNRYLARLDRPAGGLR